MKRFDWMLVLALAASAVPARGAAFPTPDMACAEKEMQLFFHYFKPDLAPGLKEYELTCSGQKSVVRMPPWLPVALPKMSEHKVWKEGDGTELSEAQLWQAPASVLYEFLKLAQKDSGEDSLYDRETDYNNLLFNYRTALDHIRRSKLEDSLDYRGAAVLAALGRVQEPLDNLMDSLPAGDTEAYQREAEAAARDARAAFALLFAPSQAASAAEYKPKPRLLPGYRGFSLPLPAHQLAFIKRGQWVDVLVTFEALLKGDVKEKVTATILQNVLVVDVLRPDRMDGRGALLLLVNPNEAQYAALSVLQGDVRVTARAEGDREMHPMEMASLRKLFK
ncbi:MAG: hypothetical protein NTY77_17310 [Elusimicrobia bacterium]|nr:hypothetical protein [Elusimicrobiota bacterium]